MRLVILITLFVGLIFGGIALLRFGARSLFPEVIQEIENPLYEAPPVVQEGLKAPSFALKNAQGEVVKSEDFLGRPLVLVFWTTWNTYAADELIILDAYLASNPAPPFALLAINSQEDRGAVANFIQRSGITLPVLLDETGQVGEQYALRVVPTTYFIDAEGIVRETVVGALSTSVFEQKASALGGEGL